MFTVVTQVNIQYGFTLQMDLKNQLNNVSCSKLGISVFECIQEVPRAEMIIEDTEFMSTVLQYFLSFLFLTKGLKGNEWFFF